MRFNTQHSVREKKFLVVMYVTKKRNILNSNKHLKHCYVLQNSYQEGV